MIEANEAVKAPWLKAYGDLPFHLEYPDTCLLYTSRCV